MMTLVVLFCNTHYASAMEESVNEELHRIFYNEALAILAKKDVCPGEQFARDWCSSYVEQQIKIEKEYEAVINGQIKAIEEEGKIDEENMLQWIDLSIKNSSLRLQYLEIGLQHGALVSGVLHKVIKDQSWGDAQKQAIELLISRGADPNEKDSNGISAYDIARKKKRGDLYNVMYKRIENENQ